MKRVYIAFDFDDYDVKQNLVTESHRAACPFSFEDGSIQKRIAQNWPLAARNLIQQSDYVLVLCGEQTHQARGVVTELQIAQELGKPYFLIQATRVGLPSKPPNARSDDKIWRYRWPTVQALLEGRTPPLDAAI